MAMAREYRRKEGYIPYMFNDPDRKPVRGKLIQATAFMLVNNKHKSKDIPEKLWPYQKNNMDEWLRLCIRALDSAELFHIFTGLRSMTSNAHLDLIYMVNDGDGPLQGKQANQNTFTYKFGPEIEAQGYVGYLRVTLDSVHHSTVYQQKKKLVAQGKLPEDAIQTRFRPKRRDGKLQVALSEIDPATYDFDDAPPRSYMYLNGTWWWKGDEVNWRLSPERIQQLGLHPLKQNWIGQLPQNPAGEQ